MILAIKRFLAKRRLESAYDILSHYEKRKDVMGRLEQPFVLVARSQVGWVLRHWKKYGAV